MSGMGFSQKFQGRVARLILQDEAFAEAVAPVLKPSQFDNPVHAWAVRTAFKHIEQFGTVPSQLALWQERRKQEAAGLLRPEHAPAYKNFLKSVGTPVPERSWVKREVHDFVQHQVIKGFMLEAVDTHMKKKDWGAIHKRMLEIVDTDLQAENSVGTVPGKSFERRIIEREQLKMDGVPSSLPALDRLMVRGGITKGQLGCVIAPTGRGKTALLVDFAVAAAMEGFKTVYYSLELDETSISTRIDARVTGVPMNLLRKNANDVRRAWKKMARVIGENLIVKAYPTGSAGISDFKAHSRKLERRGFYPDLYVIDYVDLMRPRVTYQDSSYETQGQLYRDVRGWLGEQGCGGWTATQGNRDSMSKENDGNLTLSNMADSMQKAFVADVVAGIGGSAKEVKLGLARLILLKNRNGPSFREIKMKVDFGTSTFTALNK